MSLSILFTNNTLDERRGSELWVRDVCGALVQRGHKPVAFSLVLGEVAHDLRAATVPVVSDLANVAVTPDLIHGHHHVETLIAALHFPGVPIVHFCHGWFPWEELPLQHPSIARYVTVDDTGLDRLTLESGIAPDRIDRLLNFVDLRRFPARAALPPRPARALVLSNEADPEGYPAIIAEACRAAGLALDIAGVRAGQPSSHPEQLLSGVDVVFAKGRAALEAMAVGCAVVLSDVAGCGALVTADEFDRMRSLNFGARLLREPHSVAWYRSQLSRFDTNDAAVVSARVRGEASLDKAVDQLLQIYQRALGEPLLPDLANRDLAAQRAAARHLSMVAGHFKLVQRHAGESQRQLAEAMTETARLKEERQALWSLVARYQALPTLQLRDAVLRVPLLGSVARYVARRLSREPAKAASTRQEKLPKRR